MLSRIVMLSVALVLSSAASARTSAADSLRAEKFRPVQLIAPATLITVGSIGV